MEQPDFYQEIVDASADGIWVFDLEGRTQYANRAIARMFGSGNDDVAPGTVFETLDAEGREQFAAHLEQLRAGRTNEHDVEVMFVRRDGTTFWALVSERLLPGPDGEVRVLHRFTDFDERRRVLEELSESRRQLETGQRIARVGTWEWDVARDQITGSTGLTDIFGLAPDYFPTTYPRVMESVHPFDLPQVEQAVADALAGADDFLFEARIFGNGNWIWTRGRGEVHRHPDGSIRSVTGTFQDITEAKLAEVALQDQVAQNTLMRAVTTAANEARTLRDVLVHARSLVLLHDDWERGRVFTVTDDGADVAPLYFSDQDRLDDEATPEESAAEAALARTCLAAGRPVWDERRLTIAFGVQHAGRTHAVVTITSAPPLQRYDMIEAMVQDVAVQLGRVVEREEAERSLAAARDAAMEASRLKSEFLATMSHEIRTPLHGVIGLNDLLLRTRLDPDQRRLASGIEGASRTLLGLINDILDFSKIEAGKLVLERVDFEVRRVLDQVVTVLAEPARAKGLDLHVTCDHDVPALLNGDPVRLAQVVTNLGSNAVKFTDSGEVVVHVSAAPAGGLTVLRVEVSDTGIGIERSQLDSLFDSFTQGDASTTRVHGGTGLGLAISREIVRALGGDIGVSSDPGRGSVFWFTAGFAPAVAPARDSDDDLAREHLDGCRVLLVTDNERQGEVLANQLRWWGVRCTGAGSPDRARSALAEARSSGDPFAVVLLGSVGARDGLDVAPMLRDGADPPPLLLLASTTDLDAAALRDRGITDVLTRPVPAQVLRDTLLEHAAGVRPTRERPAPATPEHRHRVLVVEDNLVNQMVAVGLLDALGYDADTADDGYAALEAFDPGRHAAVLMDVQMPRLDGYAATRALRARGGPRVPVVAMTAAAIEGERERCLAAGMDDFLTKPVEPDALAATLARWVAPPDAGTPADPAADQPADQRPAAPEADDLDRERLDMLRDMAPGDTSYLDKAIGNFSAGSAAALERVAVAAAAGDAEELVASAHKLAGSSGNLGLRTVAELALTIEELARAGTTDRAAELVPPLTQALERGRAELLAYRSAYGGG